MSSEYQPDRIDQICVRFEKEVQDNLSPNIGDFLAELDDVEQQAELFRELLWIESKWLSAEQSLANQNRYRIELPQFAGLLNELDKTEVSKSDQEQPTSVRTPQPNKIGAYKILHPIGEGGMGSVYLADQEEPVKRKVALKVIKAGMHNKSVIARFEAERQAVALMNHPCIAKILDAGATDNGEPYFAMELVEGRPLDEYCDYQKLAIADRLQLFVKVCEGVHHAHQKGIVHRDLKPANILVAEIDNQAFPKVIDFGLAKALEATRRLTGKSLQTEVGQVLGTLKYMSPEQAELDSLDIDTRSDVYTLGIILYELLTGATPLGSNNIGNQAVLRALQLVREQEAPRPSSQLSTNKQAVLTVTERRRISPRKLTQMLSGDLDWIVMKAIEKDRERRYDSASSLAADVQRYLNQEPVLARPPSLAYRMSKFVRKNRTLAASVAGVAVAILLGLAGTSYGMVWAFQEKKIANLAQTKSERLALQKSQLADEKSRLAEEKTELAERNQKVVDFFVSSFRYADPANRGVSAKLTTSEFLQQALFQIQATDWAGDSITKATLLTAMGKSFAALGIFNESIKAHKEAFDLRTSELGENDIETLRSMNDLAYGYRQAGNLDVALQLQQENYDRFTALLGPNHPETLSSWSNLALAIESGGRGREAMEINQKLLEKRRLTLGEHHPDTLNSMNNLASNYLSIGDFKEALKLFEQTLDFAQSEFGDDHPNTLKSLNNVAMTHEETGDFGTATQLRQKVLQARQEKLGENHPDTLIAIDQLATNYLSTGKYTDAIKLHQDSYERLQLRLGEDHPLTLLTLSNWAAALSVHGDVDKAYPLYKKAIRLHKARYGENSPSLIGKLVGMAFSHQKSGRLAEAIEMFADILDSYEDMLGSEHQYIVTAKNNLGVAYNKNRQAKLAAPLLEDVLAVRRKRFGDNHPSTVTAMNNLARALQSMGQLKQAIPLLEKSYEVYRSNLGEDHPTSMAFANNLAGGYLDSNRFDDAIALFTKNMEMKQKKLGEGHPDSVLSMYVLGMALTRADRNAAAVKILRQAVEVASEKLGDQHLDTLIATTRLAEALMAGKRLNEAIPLFEKTLENYETTLGPSNAYTMGLVANLASAYRTAGRPRESLDLFNRLYLHRQKKFGASNSNTVDTLRSIQALQIELERFEAAKQSVEKWQQTIDDPKRKSSADFGWSQISLAETLVGLERFKDAEALIQQALENDKLEEVHTLRANSIRGAILADRGEFEKAEKLLASSATKLAARVAEMQPRFRWYVAQSQERMVKFLQSNGSKAKVAQWIREQDKTKQLIRELPNAGKKKDF